MRPRVDALRPIAKEIERWAAVPDFLAYIEADRQIHLGLLSLAGDRYLVEVVDNLRSRSRLYGLAALAEKGLLSRSAQEHQEMLDWVMVGDEQGAIDVMKRHIGHVHGAWAGRDET